MEQQEKIKSGLETLDGIAFNINYLEGLLSGRYFFHHATPHQIEIKKKALQRFKERFNKQLEQLKF